MRADFDRLYVPPSADTFKRFVRQSDPPIDPDRLELNLVGDPERQKLRAPTTGDVSLLLSYRKRGGSRREGYVMSLAQPTPSEIQVVQFQGARQAGFRIVQGVDVEGLYAHVINGIAYHPQSPFSVLSMPVGSLVDQSLDGYVPPLAVNNDFATAEDTPMRARRHELLANQLGLTKKGDLYIRQIK